MMLVLDISDQEMTLSEFSTAAVTIGSAYVNAASNAGITSQDQNEFGFSGGLAVEAEISERVIFGTEADFIRIAGSSYLSLNGELSFWLSDTVYLPISVGYASDEGDLLAGANIGFTF